MANLSAGVVLLRADDKLEAEARRHGYPVTISADMTHPYDRALIVEQGTVVPWTMVADGFHLVTIWDAAAPLTIGIDDRHVGLAAKQDATKAEIDRTERIVHDLRMPTYGSELLFVRAGELATELIETWRNEMCHGENKRLAFLRAFYQVKPRLCALPSIWRGGARVRSWRSSRARQPVRLRRRGAAHPNDLVRVEIKPGVYVRCRRGEEEKMLAQMGISRRGRHGRRS